MWDDFYKFLRLTLLNFDFDGMSDDERVRNVSPDQKNIAIDLYWSNMGIGWPLKVIFLMFIATPYSIIIIAILKIIEYIRLLKNDDY